MTQEHAEPSSDSPASKEFTFTSSSRPDVVHTVTVTNGVARCTCEGFRARRTCRHINEVQKDL